MSRASLVEAIPASDRLLLDASVLIAYLDGGERASTLAIQVIDDFVRSGRNSGIVSMISVMEVLVRPLRLGAPEPYRHVMDFFASFPNLRPLAVDLVVAQEAASLRATYAFSPPDALTIATGIVAQVGHLVPMILNGRPSWIPSGIASRCAT